MFSSNTSSADGGYQISRSLRFNSPDSAYLNRTPASAGNRTTWTWSGWAKVCDVSTYGLFCIDSNNRFLISSGNLFFDYQTAGTYRLVSSAVYRDPSAWYHIVLAVDTTQATASNRIKIYVNGSQVTDFSTANYPTQNLQSSFNNTVQHNIGAENARYYFNGYMTDVNFIDGQALTPSSFGETDAQTGVWKPKAYSGSYGTNGFYLNFSDNSNTTAATLGKDYSGNGNNWTPNNFSVSAGAGNDSLVDTPIPYGVDTGAGGNVRGNYATLNPLNATPSPSISNGNLYQVSTTSGHMNGSSSTIAVSSGKWYAEVVFTRIAGSTDSFFVGLADAAWQAERLDAGGWYGRFWYFPTGYCYADNGQKYTNNSGTSYGATYTQGDVIGVAYDADAGTVVFYKNGVSQGTAYTGITGAKTIAASCYKDSSITLAFDINFGQRPFAYTAPSGYKALCTQNLPTPAIGATSTTQANKYFDVVLRNGGGSSGGTYSTTVNMSNGALLWDKPRNQASSNYLVDSVRGISKTLRSNTTDAEVTDTSWFTGFNSSSFTTGSSDWGTGVTVVDWIWAANGAGSSNTAGSITSTVSANTTSGFSIVTYTGTGANATVGHGLGVAPSMIIARTRNQASQWSVYHTSLGAGNAIFLDLTNASGSYPAIWNSTAPTSTVFSVGTSNTVNYFNQQQIAYCFAEVPGFSKFGSYTGNGSTDGPFVFCGFRPAYVMIKRTSDVSGWVIFDTKRTTSNVMGQYLYANASDAEATYTTIDFLSNGFKMRLSDTSFNGSGSNFIFAAFAEAPFKYALAR